MKAPGGKARFSAVRRSSEGERERLEKERGREGLDKEWEREGSEKERVERRLVWPLSLNRTLPPVEDQNGFFDVEETPTQWQQMLYWNP